MPRVPRPDSAVLRTYTARHLDAATAAGCVLWTGPTKPWIDAAGVAHERPVIDLPTMRGTSARRVMYRLLNPDADVDGLDIRWNGQCNGGERCVNPEHCEIKPNAYGRAAAEYKALGIEMPKAETRKQRADRQYLEDAIAHMPQPVMADPNALATELRPGYTYRCLNCSGTVEVPAAGGIRSAAMTRHNACGTAGQWTRVSGNV